MAVSLPKVPPWDSRSVYLKAKRFNSCEEMATNRKGKSREPIRNGFPRRLHHHCLSYAWGLSSVRAQPVGAKSLVDQTDPCFGLPFTVRLSPNPSKGDRRTKTPSFSPQIHILHFINQFNCSPPSSPRKRDRLIKKNGGRQISRKGRKMGTGESWSLA